MMITCVEIYPRNLTGNSIYLTCEGGGRGRRPERRSLLPDVMYFFPSNLGRILAKFYFSHLSKYEFETELGQKNMLLK